MAGEEKGCLTNIIIVENSGYLNNLLPDNVILVDSGLRYR